MAGTPPQNFFDNKFKNGRNRGLYFRPLFSFRNHRHEFKNPTMFESSILKEKRFTYGTMIKTA